METRTASYQAEAEKLHDDINKKYQNAKQCVGAISAAATSKKLTEASKTAQRHIIELQDAQQRLLYFEESQVSDNQRDWVRRLRIRTADLAPVLAQKKRRALIRAERRLLQQKKEDLTGGAVARSRRAKASVGLEAQNRRQVGMSFKRTRRILQQSLDQMDVANAELQNSTEVVRRAAGLTNDYTAAGEKGKSRMRRMNLQRYKDQITFGIAFFTYLFVCVWVIVKRVRRLFPNLGFCSALCYGFKFIIGLAWSLLISFSKETSGGGKLEIVDSHLDEAGTVLSTEDGLERTGIPGLVDDDSALVNKVYEVPSDTRSEMSREQGFLSKGLTGADKADLQTTTKNRHEEL